MRRFIKIVAAVAVVLLLAFVGVGLLLPSSYRVERSIVIGADAPAIHVFVGDLRRWPEWTPWQDADPSIRIEPGAKTHGVGAQQSWTGDSGNGALIFTDSAPETGVRYDLSFDDGAFESRGAVLYHPQGSNTRVTWQMTGDAGMNIVKRYFGVMMDRMVGPMFDSGLQKLKEKVEKND